jgi:hypothetical protein
MIRGRGDFVLTKNEIRFSQWTPQKEIHIPRYPRGASSINKACLSLFKKFDMPIQTNDIQ